MNYAQKICKQIFLFLVGGTIYTIIEIIWRWLLSNSPTHWTMFILGGLSFVCIGWINEIRPYKISFWLQCLIGTVIILSLEFIFGCVLNIFLNMNIWDYSHLPFNILGQVCLPFAFAWYALTAVAIIADDYLRYWIFNEEKPHYFMKLKKI